MSTVVQKDNEEYLLFVKGADNVMLGMAVQRATQNCDVVIACCASPMQKAELAKLFREAAPKSQKSVSAAVADCVNDVPMIQDAQVDIGIACPEGRQSVNYSDFATGQLKYL